MKTDETEGMWKHEVKTFCECLAAKITHGDRLIGWHVQDSSRAEVFFVAGPDVTMREIEMYSKSLKDGGFKFAIVYGQDEFREFVEDCKHEFSPMFLMAATTV